MKECAEHDFAVQYQADKCPICEFSKEIWLERKDRLIKAMARGLINGQIRPAWRRPIYKTGYVLKDDL